MLILTSLFFKQMTDEEKGSINKVIQLTQKSSASTVLYSGTVVFVYLHMFSFQSLIDAARNDSADAVKVRNTYLGLYNQEAIE